MKIKTKYLGDLEVDKEKIIRFPNGIPGFPDETKFVLLDLSDYPVFRILQSVDSPHTAFFVINPFLIYEDYEFSLDDPTLDTLQIKKEEDVVTLSIVTLREPFESSTINLKAPIIIHSNQMLGKQYILNKEDYPSKAVLKLRPVMEGVSSC